jgi:hypothetical protein
MKTSNLFNDLIDLNRALEKDIELFRVKIGLNSKSTTLQHQLVRIEVNSDPVLQRRGQILISNYIGNQLLRLKPQVIYPGLASELNHWRLTESFITSGQPRIIPAVVGYLHFKNDFLTDYFDGISDITVSVIPSVSPSTTQDKLLIGVTATIFIKKIETENIPAEPVDVGFISRREVDVNENIIPMDTSPNVIDYYGICFNGLTGIIERDQILRKKIIEELTKFV